jgi:quinolinate synthase
MTKIRLGDITHDTWKAEIRRLAKERNALILAHNYQLPEIQDVADYVGDSLALSRIAAGSDAEMIVFAGVYFMAETAKILSPEKTVLIPEPKAGCSLAESINADQLRAWKKEYPNAVVVAYVNTTAEVKAETDLCCTSANAVEIVNTIDRDREILFLPDQFLGAHVKRMTGRDNMHVWMGECHVHAGITPQDLIEKVEGSPSAELFIHPECGCTTTALWMSSNGDLPMDRTKILSTGAMLEEAKTTAASSVLVATEVGMLYQLRNANPKVSFEPVNSKASCKYMKMTTRDVLMRCLREGTYEVLVEEDIINKARSAVEAMISVGSPSMEGE